MPLHFYTPWLRRLLLLSLCCATALVGRAQTAAEAQANRTAIQAFYPVMVAHVNAGRLDEARVLCQKAIAWEPNEAVHRYNLACIESKAGRPTDGFAALGQAVALGYADANSLRTDPDLAALRADARFAGLIQATTRNVGATAARTPAAAEPRAYAPARPAAPAAARPPLPAPAPARLGPATMPAPAAWANGKLTGLFFMTKYYVFNGFLEKAVWYFAPDGRVYYNPTGGFGAAELAATRASDQGTYRLAGGKLSVKWSDGKTSDADFELTNGGFNWDTGLFTPVKPFANASGLVGQFEGGASISGSGGSVAVSSSLHLRADGTYAMSGVSSLSSKSAESTVSTGGQSQNSGRWTLSGYSMTLTDAQGKVTRGIAFPFDDKSTAVYPDRFYFAGTMYKKQ